MKYLSNTWEKQFDGIQYFIQRLEEMLFHYSCDIFRAPVHNTKTLLMEFKKTLVEVKNGEVKEYLLNAIIEELKDSFINDKILIEIFGMDFVEDCAKKISIKNLDLISYLNNKISFDEYFQCNIAYLKKHIICPNHKKEIEFGLRCWIVLILSQYSPEYIYNHLNKIFTNNLTPKESIMYFFDSLLFESHSYRVYFFFTKNLRGYKQLIENRLDVKFVDDGFFSKIYHKNIETIGYFELKSVDPYSAMQCAFDKLNIFIKYFRVLSNKTSKLVEAYGFVREINETTIIKLQTKIKKYRLIESDPAFNLTSMIDGIILACQSKNRLTYERLNRILDLHNESLQQSFNNSFLNLWSVLEIICVEKDAVSKVESVINGVLPILESDYYVSIFANIKDDLRDNLSKRDYYTLLENISDVKDDVVKIAQLIFLDKYNDLLEEIFIKLKDFPLIRNKIYQLNNVKKIELFQKLCRYSNRVKWHIYRLYRVRNSIVHSGRNNEKVQTLGEHLHLYVDNVINEVVIKLASESKIQTIQDVLVDAKLLSHQKKAQLEQGGSITEDDIRILREAYYFRLTKKL